MVLPRPAGPCLEVVLEVRVPAPDLMDPRECFLGEPGAAEIRVHDDSGGVDHPPQSRREELLELGLGPADEVVRVEARLDLFARAREGGAGCLEDELTTVLLAERLQ